MTFYQTEVAISPIRTTELTVDDPQPRTSLVAPRPQTLIVVEGGEATDVSYSEPLVTEVGVVQEIITHVDQIGPVRLSELVVNPYAPLPPVDVNLTYDAQGRLSVVSSTKGVKTLSYNADGQLETVDDPARGILKTLMYSGGKLVDVLVSPST